MTTISGDPPGSTHYYLALPAQHSTPVRPQISGVQASLTTKTDFSHNSARTLRHRPAGHVLGLQQQLLPHSHRVQNVDVGIEDLISFSQAPGSSDGHLESGCVRLVDGSVDGGLAGVVHHGGQGEHQVYLSVTVRVCECKTKKLPDYQLAS